MIKKSILHSILIMLIASVSSTTLLAEDNNNIFETMANFSSNDMEKIYQNCGNENSQATSCANTFNMIAQKHFKNIKPITATEIDSFWKNCDFNADNKLCADTINSLLKTHNSNIHYTVSESDVQKAKLLNAFN